MKQSRNGWLLHATHVKAVSSSAMGAEGRGDSERPRGYIAGAFLANGFPKRKPRRRWGWWRGFNGRLAKEG